MVTLHMSGTRAAFFEHLVDGVEGGLGVERVEDGLHQQDVHATVEQASTCSFVGGHELVEGDGAEAGSFTSGLSEAVLFIGPMAPATKRGLLGSMAVCLRRLLARRAEARFISRARWLQSCSACAMLVAEKVFVSTMSAPAARYCSWMVRMAFGPREREQLVVALEQDLVVLHALRMEVLLRCRPKLLDHGAHGPVEDEDALGRCVRGRSSVRWYVRAFRMRIRGEWR